jgi:DNA-binding transcriptional MerR regulator
MKYYKTSEIAKNVGVHPNTVRLYEEWGLLQSVPRNEKGYRLYTEKHLDQMCLARIALRCEFIEGDIRKLATSIVKTTADGKFKEALQEAYSYLNHIRGERKKAIESLDLINRWINGELEEHDGIYIKRKDVANLLNVSIDVLRNWERNGLIEVPRNSINRYRVYGSKEINRLKIIRTLRIANYSMMAILRMLKYIDRGNKENFDIVIDTPSHQEDIVSATDRWISTLAETEEDVFKLIEKLKEMIEKNNS